jgi:hypothetical protein
MPKSTHSNELVKVVANSLTYDVQDEHLHESISGYEIREMTQAPDPMDFHISITFGSAVSNALAIRALRMVQDKIEADGLPSLVTNMEKRAATRLVKLQKDAAKASKLLANVPEESRAQVKRMLDLDI